MATHFVHTQIRRSDNLNDKVIQYLKYWHLYLIILVLSLAAVWLYLTYATPSYKITSTLQIIDDKRGEGLLKTTAFSDLNMFQETKTVDNETEVLRSRDLIYDALKKLNLQTSYYDLNDFRSKELYGSNVPFQVVINRLNQAAYLRRLQIQSLSDSTFALQDGNSSWIYRFGQDINHKDYAFKVNKGPAFTNDDQNVEIAFKDLYKMASAYSAGKLLVVPVIKESNTLDLSLIDPVPARGIDIMASIISTYNLQSEQKKNTMAVNTILFIDKRLKTMEHELSSTEGGIEAYKQRTSATDIGVGTQLNLGKTAEYAQLLTQSNVQLGIANSLDKYLSDSNNQFSVVPSSMGLTDPVLNNLINRFNDLQLERNRMLQSASLNNPLVQNLSNQIANLRVNIKENLNNIKEGLNIEHNYLKSNTAEYDSRVRSVPAVERGLLQLSREQSVKTGLYQYLLQKREETALSLSATIPSSQVIDKPSFNPVPEYPKQPLMYLYGSIFGLLLPTLIVYRKNHVNPKVRYSSNLNHIPGVRILGELNHNEVKSPIAIQKGNSSTISELFRYIRANLGTLNPDVPNKVMLVTSCMRGEGKTFFSINLGLTLSLLNKKVLILEFDLRKPDMVQKLGLSQTKGISDFLQGDIDNIKLYIQSYKNADNIYVLGCGTIPKNPAELLLNDRVELLFELLKDDFDHIIIDTSPVGTVADAFSLSPFTDLSIFLVRYNYTNLQQLDILRDIYNHKKLQNPMVVFNDAKKENRPAYAYGGYGYNIDGVARSN